MRQELARERQKKQIILTGLKLEPKSTTSKIYDKIDDILKELYVNFEQRDQDTFVNAFDFKFIGRQNDEKARPILVEFETEFERDRVVRMAFVLKDSDSYSNIYIQKCLSKEEQKEQYLLREQRRQNAKKSH